MSMRKPSIAGFWRPDKRSPAEGDKFARTGQRTIVHIKTELRLAWRRDLEAFFGKKPHEGVPCYLSRKNESRKLYWSDESY